MIATTRAASIAPGKSTSALAYIREMAGYMKSTYGVDYEVLIPIGGNPNRVAMSTRHQDLGAFDAVSSKVRSDKQYTQLIEKGSENYIAGPFESPFGASFEVSLDWVAVSLPARRTSKRPSANPFAMTGVIRQVRLMDYGSHPRQPSMTAFRRLTSVAEGRLWVASSSSSAWPTRPKADGESARPQLTITSDAGRPQPVVPGSQRIASPVTALWCGRSLTSVRGDEIPEPVAQDLEIPAGIEDPPNVRSSRCRMLAADPLLTVVAACSRARNAAMTAFGQGLRSGGAIFLS
jgi:hypothetical protein